jgi:hypothetical protein
MNDSPIIGTMASTNYSTTSKKVNKDNIDKEVRVEQVENGYIITIEKSWKDKKEGYQCETKKYISKDNPFDNEKKEGETNTLGDSLESFLNGGGDVEIDE